MLYKTLDDSPAGYSDGFKELSGEWEYLRDIFHGIIRWSELKDGVLVPTEKARNYLPKHPEEDATEYLHRFRLTEFDDSFSRALKEYTDLMFANGIEITAPDWFLKHWDSLSDCGDSANVLFPQIALNSLLFGVSHIFIDYAGDRPRWVPVQPYSVPNWSVEMIDGVQVLSHVSITSRTNKINYVTRYNRGGEWQRWAYLKTDDGWQFEQIDAGVLRAKSKPIIEIPLVSFFSGYSRQSFLVGDRLFRSLADKNKTLYQVTSDYRRKMQLCNTPQPVQYDPMGDETDIVLSPSRILRMRSPDAYFRWEEANTSSLFASRQEMIDITDTIRADSSRFLQSPTARVSAGAADMSVAPLQATLLGFSNLFTESVHKAIAVHQNYMGDNSEIEVEIMPSLQKQQPKDSQSALSASNLYTAGVLTRHSAIKMLNEAHVISDELTDEELKNPAELKLNE